MILDVVIPVGPGHLDVSRECMTSVQNAWDRSHGPFTSMSCRAVYDLQGKYGRCWARNLGIANAPNADWYFLIDADDVIHVDAFELFKLPNNHTRAVFGAVCTDRHGIIRHNVYPCSWEQIMQHGANKTLSTGAFFSGPETRGLGFLEDIDSGEDFEFYLAFLSQHDHIKLQHPLVTARLDVPSATGPRSSSPDWQKACKPFIDFWHKRGRMPLSSKERSLKNYWLASSC